MGWDSQVTWPGTASRRVLSRSICPGLASAVRRRVGRCARRAGWHRSVVSWRGLGGLVRVAADLAVVSKAVAAKRGGECRVAALVAEFGQFVEQGGGV